MASDYSHTLDSWSMNPVVRLLAKLFTTTYSIAISSATVKHIHTIHLTNSIYSSVLSQCVANYRIAR